MTIGSREIWPPNPAFGTLEEFKRLADVCAQSGVLFAPHDNYIDFYPDANGFSYDNTIVFTQGGTPQRGWLNEGRGAQGVSFPARPVSALPGRQLAPNVRGHCAHGLLHRRLLFGAPRWILDPARQLRHRVGNRKYWGEAFSWIRDFLGGDAPQISEAATINSLAGSTARRPIICGPGPRPMPAITSVHVGSAVRGRRACSLDGRRASRPLHSARGGL